MRKIEKKVKKGDAEEDRTFYTAPKIQRLITDVRLRRKKLNRKHKVENWKKTKEAHVAYEKLLSKFLKEKKAAYKESHAKTSEKSPAVTDKAPKVEPKKEAPKAAAKPAAKTAKPAPKAE